MRKLSLNEYGMDQHHHMLGCGRAWFEGKFPNEWAVLKHQPAEQAIDRMLDLMQGIYIKIWVSNNSSKVAG